MRNGQPPGNDRSWWPTLAAAVIGAAATILVGFVANKAGAVHITFAPVPTHTVTITPPPAPTVTVAAPSNTVPSNSSGETGSTTCLPGQNCKISNLSAPMGTSSGGPTGINLSQGAVALNNSGDLRFQAADDGAPELISDEATAYSEDVTAQNASRRQCQSATTTAPDPNPITNFHTGLLFCVATSGGIALVEQTQPLGSSKTLYLQDTYWPNTTA
jgi:hypothetical protein